LGRRSARSVFAGTRNTRYSAPSKQLFCNSRLSRRHCAYYTFAATGIPFTDLAPEVTRRLPRYPTVPAALIGRLAVDQRFRGQALGAALIVDAIARAMRAEPAIFALVVDAKDDTALRFISILAFNASSGIQ
jgi:predicted GNAT family N-acyltransferase